MVKAFDRSSTALLVIDMQNDFCHQGGYFAQTGRNITHMQSIIPRLREVIDKAREVGIRVIFIKSHFDEKYLSLSMKVRKVHQKRTEDVCREGTWGAELILSPEKDDIVIVKHAYSAFIMTSLEKTLREKAITSLVVTGVLTNVCCESTLRDGFMLGFNTALIEDCCGSDSMDAHNCTLYNVSNYFGWIVDSGGFPSCLLENRTD